MKSTPIIAVTSGEPAGIGPDLCAGLFQKSSPLRLVILGDPEVLSRRAEMLGNQLELPIWKGADQPAGAYCLPVKCRQPVRPGFLLKENSIYVLEMLDRAVAGCLSGEFDAMVTAPVHKGIINDAGFPFSGHTEYLAQLANISDVLMMLATRELRVALLTTHLPLREVPQAITTERLSQGLDILHEDLKTRFSLSNPHICVCGLNPHAGEQGHLGTEEQEIMLPVIEKLRREGRKIDGPLPADTAFTPNQIKKCDAYLTMYHDQGLPVLKHTGFGEAVNITLGLPFIRTSVDHGTALTLAGTGKASSASLDAAITLAAELA